MAEETSRGVIIREKRIGWRQCGIVITRAGVISFLGIGVKETPLGYHAEEEKTHVEEGRLSHF